MLNICSCSRVCDKVMWTEGVYNSHRLKGPCEDQVFGHYTLALEESM